MNWKVSLTIIIIGILIGVSSLLVPSYAIILTTAGIIFVLAGVLTYSMPSKKGFAIALAMTAIILAATFFYQSRAIIVGPSIYNRGLPYAYYTCLVGPVHMFTSNTTLLAEMNKPRCNLTVGPNSLPYVWLALDILFWFTVSSAALSVIGKFKKKKIKVDFAAS